MLLRFLSIPGGPEPPVSPAAEVPMPFSVLCGHLHSYAHTPIHTEKDRQTGQTHGKISCEPSKMKVTYFQDRMAQSRYFHSKRVEQENRKERSTQSRTKYHLHASGTHVIMMCTLMIFDHLVSMVLLFATQIASLWAVSTHCLWLSLTNILYS